MPSPQPSHVAWQIKASTLCNLRCRYCYEWDRLADRRRLTLPQWQQVLQAAAEYRGLRERECRHPVGTHIILHGGEPLLLPLSYLRHVFALGKDFLGPADRLSIHTNLTVLPDALLGWLQREDVQLGVSWDGDAGVRRDRAGRPADRRVLANLHRLRDAGIRFGVVLVLGTHNHRDLPAIYDRLEALGAGWLNVVPVFQSTTPAGAAELVLTPAATHAALVALYEHWSARDRRLPVQPLLRAERTVRYRQRGQQRPRDGTRFVVQPDGRLSIEGGTASESVTVGNLLMQSMPHILASAPYAAALARAEDRRRRHCAACAYRGACNARPVLDLPQDCAPGPCPVEARLCAHIESLQPDAAATDPPGWHHIDLPALLPGREASPRPAGV